MMRFMKCQTAHASRGMTKLAPSVETVRALDGRKEALKAPSGGCTANGVASTCGGRQTGFGKARSAFSVEHNRKGAFTDPNTLRCQEGKHSKGGQNFTGRKPSFFLSERGSRQGTGRQLSTPTFLFPPGRCFRHQPARASPGFCAPQSELRASAPETMQKGKWRSPIDFRVLPVSH